MPNTPSVICLVKVSAIGSTTVEDQSGAVFAIYSTSIFREDFNGPWTTASPPAGWRITYTGAPSIAAWHDEPASGGPWFSNGTPMRRSTTISVNPACTRIH